MDPVFLLFTSLILAGVGVLIYWSLVKQHVLVTIFCVSFNVLGTLVAADQAKDSISYIFMAILIFVALPFLIFYGREYYLELERQRAEKEKKRLADQQTEEIRKKQQEEQEERALRQVKIQEVLHNIHELDSNYQLNIVPFLNMLYESHSSSQAVPSVLPEYRSFYHDLSSRVDSINKRASELPMLDRARIHTI